MANITNLRHIRKKVSQKVAEEQQKSPKKSENSQKNSKNRTAKWWAFKEFLDMKWKFRNDIVRNRLMWRTAGGSYEEVLPNDLFGQIQSDYGDLKKNYIFDVVLDTRIARHYNPLKNWFKNLKCDKDIDYVDELCSYISLKDNSDKERQRLYISLKKWFLGAVKTLFEPRYVHKQCIIWQGEQGLGKTPFVESLLPDEYQDFVNSIRNMNLESKDAKIALTTSFIMNFDEVDQFFKTDKNRNNYKSYMTTRQVNVRLPFGRTEVSRLRIAAFMGSCNESAFLNDSTGTQRFTIFELEKFLNKKYGVDRFIEDFAIKNVWAYAYKLYMRGAEAEYTIEEEKANEEANEAHKWNSDEFNTIIEWLAPAAKPDAGNDLVEFMTATQVRVYMNSVQEAVSFGGPRRLGQVLRRLKYIRCKKNINGQSLYGYYVRKLKEKAPQWGPVIQPHKIIKLN